MKRKKRISKKTKRNNRRMLGEVEEKGKKKGEDENEKK